jgi:hypothetical protein
MQTYKWIILHVDYSLKYSFDGRSYFADIRMTCRQNFFLQDWFRNKLGVGLAVRAMIRLRIVWNRVSVSKTVALLRFVTLRPATHIFLVKLRNITGETNYVIVSQNAL